jgi:outer membrane protein OmpA-like peptidoglycan-associated protein
MMPNNKTCWWIVLIGWVAASAYWHTCKIKQLCDAPLVSPVTIVPKTAPTNISSTHVDEVQLHSKSSENLASVESDTEDSLSTDNDLANYQKYESIFKPLDLYFPKASTGYIRTPENQKFLTEAKKYLSENKDKKLILTGYSDSEDSAEWNLKLSRKRAEIVKYKFVSLGVPADRIVTFGKGEANPKASNDTPEGRRANRRVSIIVQ